MNDAKNLFVLEGEDSGVPGQANSGIAMCRGHPEGPASDHALFHLQQSALEIFASKTVENEVFRMS